MKQEFIDVLIFLEAEGLAKETGKLYHPYGEFIKESLKLGDVEARRAIEKVWHSILETHGIISEKFTTVFANAICPLKS